MTTNPKPSGYDLRPEPNAPAFLLLVTVLLAVYCWLFV